MTIERELMFQPMRDRLSVKAKRTRDSYASDWKLFSRWCDRHHESALPATAATVVAYLSFMTEAGRKVSTMSRALVSINFAHQAAYCESPVGSFPVREAMKGFRRLLGVAQKKKKPLLLADLRAIFAAMPEPNSPIAARDRALLLVGVRLCARRSELTSMHVEDITFVSKGMIVRLRRGLTLVTRGGSSLCPVKAMRKWLTLSGIATGGVFRRVHKTGTVGDEAITGGMIARIVQQHAARIGKSASDFGGHSLRRGGCTALARAGVGDVQIMLVSGHRSSEQLRRCIQDDAGLFPMNVSIAMGL
jgi:integrase